MVPDKSSSSRFEPKPDQQIYIGSEKFRFEAARDVKAFKTVFMDASGRRSMVYRLANSRKNKYALKVFREKFRSPDLHSTAQRLIPLRKLPGFRVAERTVLLPQEPVVQMYPELAYSMLMPWIGGTTWRAILMRAGEGEIYLQPAAAVHLALHFLTVMRGLEHLPATHTDVAGGNVTIDVATLKIELLDLEDMFFPSGVDRGNRGATGYTHWSRPSLACPAGDRYATAVLAAEILAMAEPSLAIRAEEEGYFKGNQAVAPGPERFKHAEKHLTVLAPEFMDLFRQAWFSKSLADCPRIEALYDKMLMSAQRNSLGADPLLLTPQPSNHRPGIPNVNWISPGATASTSRQAPAQGSVTNAQIKKSHKGVSPTMPKPPSVTGNQSTKGPHVTWTSHLPKPSENGPINQPAGQVPAPAHGPGTSRQETQHQDVA